MDILHTKFLFAWLKPNKKKLEYIDFNTSDEKRKCSIVDISNFLLKQNLLPSFFSKCMLYIEGNFPILIDLKTETLSLYKNPEIYNNLEANTLPKNIKNKKDINIILQNKLNKLHTSLIK